MQQHTDQEYINTDIFSGDEGDLTCRTILIRTARKEHKCYTLNGSQNHTIKPGERYRYEKALVDSDFWGEYRMCLKCMDEFLKEPD